jgi:hypothetical protein
MAHAQRAIAPTRKAAMLGTKLGVLFMVMDTELDIAIWYCFVDYSDAPGHSKNGAAFQAAEQRMKKVEAKGHL